MGRGLGRLGGRVRIGAEGERLGAGLMDGGEGRGREMIGWTYGPVGENPDSFSVVRRHYKQRLAGERERKVSSTRCTMHSEERDSLGGDSCRIESQGLNCQCKCVQPDSKMVQF